MLHSGLSAFLASLGFGVIFNIRGKKLLVAAFCGAVGGGTYSLALAYQLSETMALLIGTMALSIAAELFARLLKGPVTIFLVCALIPLVPGGGMYYTMIEMVQGNVDAAITTCVKTILNAGAIAIGCTLVASCTRLIMKLRQRKVR